MKYVFLLSILAVGTLFVTGAIAQHEGHEGHTAPPAADKSAAAPAKGDAKQAMKGGMMAEHAEVAKLVDQLVTGFEAIETEKDPAALKAELAEHGKLLKELQAKVQGKSQMMEQMHGQMQGKMQEKMKGKMKQQ